MDSKKMREYKYIRNTLPNNSASSSGDGLGIGKQVINLLPELNEENIGEEKSWKIVDANLGTLATTVDLKPNTNYSIQIMNRSVKDGQEYNPSTTLPSTFFQTGPQEISQTITISGLTPYFNLENSRYWKSDIKPSAYLFETDNAWLIDRDGVIFGQSLEPFVYLGDVSDTTLPIEYTDEKIAEIFTAPVIDTSLSISVSSDILLYKTNTSHSVSLGVYRDALVNDRKVVWNKKEYYNRYGKLGHIGNGGVYTRKYVKTDEAKADILKSKRFSVNIQDYVVEEETSITIMQYEPNRQYPIDKKDDNTSKVPFNIALGSVLSCNKNFAEQQGLPKEIKNKYTSVALKWIVKDDDGNVIYISPASNPILIDRSISKGWKYAENGTSEWWSFTPKNFTIKIETDDENYPLLVSNPIFIVKE